METKFEELKKEILKRAKAANACSIEYRRAYSADSAGDLMRVIKDNFRFAVDRKVIDPLLIEAYKDQFTANEIYCNVNVTSGFLLATGNATVKAWGSATVKAWGSATVEAMDSATVEAWGNATVEAWDNATVKAWDNATVKATDSATVKATDSAYVLSRYTIECKLTGNAIHRIIESNTIRYASGDIIFEKV
jgi:pyruvate/2-oxoglutarate/acetoin dehydrogenase E1 component